MKSKHFDSIIMDDIIGELDSDTMKKHMESVKKWINNGKRKSVVMPRGHFKTDSRGIYSIIQEWYEKMHQDPLAPHILDLFEEAEGVDLQARQSQER